jgi:hypothetical protein
VIEFHSFLHWIAAGHGDQQSSSPLNDTITAAVATNGIIYRLFLASIFIPAFLILRRRAQDLARVALPSAPREEQTKWLENLALTPALPRHIINLLAVVSPFLAGLPLARLLDLMK